MPETSLSWAYNWEESSLNKWNRNVFRVYSFRPERLSAWFSHYKQLHEPTDNLSAAEREMIAVAVSMANGCLYLPGGAWGCVARGSR
jgi:alkylhydroperoxidase family enzyme